MAYKIMAAELRVPIPVLVGHILTQWFAQNGETLISNEQERQEYGDYLAKKYLAKSEER